MNLNVKLDEEQQPVQYVNGFAINIPSTAFNFNIVNSGLNNQSYILNPVNTVGQNIVTYPSMTLQSYFTLPSESEGNVIHSLPVGVPVPVGLPVQTGFLQNTNFVNTSIIIGNDDSTSILESDTNSGDNAKLNYMQNEEEIVNNNETSLGLNCSVTSENSGKKLCPLEMSIKAANIDMEFEKCDQSIPIITDTSTSNNTNQKVIVNNLPLESSCVNESFNLCSMTPAQILKEITAKEDCGNKIQKTEITWEKNNVEANLNDDCFQESLICEVEEVNDDDEDLEEDVVDNEEEEIEKNDCNNEDVQSSNVEGKGNMCLVRLMPFKSDASSSSEESDVPLSVALKLKKLPESKIENSKKRKNENINKRKYKRGRKISEASEEDGEEWSESDDDVLKLKLVKNDSKYKCYYESKTSKALNSVSKTEDKIKKFVRVRSCCSKRECSKNVSVKYQMAAHKHFYELQSDIQRDFYLLSCMEQEKTENPTNIIKVGYDFENSEDQNNVDRTSIRKEIENESNGNPKLSDEIQNAINESLKDCIISKEKGENLNCGNVRENLNSDKQEKNNWNYYIVIDKFKKNVCLQFLLKVLRVTKTRIKQLQKKIISGMPLGEDVNIAKSEQKDQEVWDMAKIHLENLGIGESLYCTANPRHRFLAENFSREQLFDKFKEYYNTQNGKELNLKFSPYKRFLEKDVFLSFTPKKEGICADCENSKLKKRQSRSNRDSTDFQFKSINGQTKKKNIESDFSSSEEEFLSKPKKIKLTVPLKGVDNSDKLTENLSKRNSKNSCVIKKGKAKLGKEKNKQPVSKGRDVWSLMLLHLETIPYKECNACTKKKKHRFLTSSFTTRGLFEEYRKYFLKETNSELGLGFPMYEKYFNRNCNYTIHDISTKETACPRCIADQYRSQ